MPYNPPKNPGFLAPKWAKDRYEKEKNVYDSEWIRERARQDSRRK